MRHAVVAYPKLEEADRLWIETIRSRHDPQAALIAAHFTLVFPAAVEAEMMKAAAMRAARTSGAFAVELDRAVAHRDAPESPSHVFLLPTAGDGPLRRLHEAMYDGGLRQWLDQRIPYRPHLTVAAGLTERDASSLTDDMSRHPLKITGAIDALTVVSIGERGLSTVAVVPLERIASSK